jgi:hypothetical protein
MGIMLVYDITDGKSFDSIGKWLRNIDEVCLIMNDLKISKKKFLFFFDNIECKRRCSPYDHGK